MDRMLWGHYTIYGRSFFFFFLPFSSSSSLNSYKPTAGDGNGDNVEILLFFFCFPFFVAFSSNPFFLLLQRTPDTKSLRLMAAPSAGAVL